MVDVLGSRIQLGSLLKADSRNLSVCSTEAVLGPSPYDHGNCPLHYSPACFVMCYKCNYLLEAGILQCSCKGQVPVAVASMRCWTDNSLVMNIPEYGLPWL
jgi:hypothetical protein